MRDYRDTQSSGTARRTQTIIVVGVLHVLVGYALVSGLARKVVEVIKAPIETKIIEEVRKPPPDTPPPPPPKLATPPPPFIPPPEINIQTPIQQAQTITTVTTTKPPPGPPPKAAPPAPTQAPAVRKNVKPVGEIVRPVFPRQAIRDGVQSGTVVAHLVIRPDGSVSEVRIISAKPPRIFDREVQRALSQWRFAPEPIGFVGEVEIEFKLE